MDVLEHLTEEHRKAEALMAKLADSDPGADREATLAELEDALATHMAVEERFVYPIVAKVVGDDDEQGAENEHGLTRAGLQKARELVGQPGFAAAIEMLQAGIGHHVKEEEQDIFPQLREEAQDEIEGLGDPESLESKVKSGGAGSEPTKDELYGQAQEAGIEGRSTMTKDELAAALESEQ